jgi:hypothetical protein
VNERTIEWLQGWLETFERATQATAKKTSVSPEDGAYMLNAIHAMSEMIR